jgi:glycosyltransferase involved in cell wall biosynthesis
MSLVATDQQFPRWIGWTRHIPFLRTLFRFPLYTKAVFASLGEADIAHVFAPSYAAFLLIVAPVFICARLRRKPCIVHYHSGEAADHLRRSRTARALLRRAALVIVPSEYLVEVLARHSIRSILIPNMIDLAQFRFRQRDQFRPNLICTRMHEPYYRVDHVVRAFAEVQKYFPEAQLQLIGTGSQERKIRALVSELNLSGVEFCGSLAPAEIPACYDRADIFVNASEVDNMPVSIMEAFACGTAVVTTAAGGIRCLVKHEQTGLLCEPGDWQGLASAVIRLCREPVVAAKLADNAYQQSLTYGSDRVRKQWLSAYETLLAPEKFMAAVAGHEARSA